MHIELYDQTKLPADVSALDTPDCTAFEDYAVMEDLKARIIIARNLGLTAQAHELTPLHIAYCLKREITYPFLSKEQERALAQIFPTRYKHNLSDSDLRAGFRRLDQYRYDLIPLPVLAAWNEAHEQRLFSTYEVWTAEARRLPDPVLMGRRREHGFLYLIARWGETLRTWEELAERDSSLLLLPTARRTA